MSRPAAAATPSRSRTATALAALGGWAQRHVVLLVLLTGGLASLGWYQLWEALNRRAMAEETKRQLPLVADQLQHHLLDLEHGLGGARGYVLGVGVDRVTAAGFSRYLATRNLDREFNGVRTWGMVRRVAPAARADYEARLRRQGEPGFETRMLAGAELADAAREAEWRVVQVIEPRQDNLDLLGRNLAPIPARQAAMDRALEWGQASMSAPLGLTVAALEAPGDLQVFLPLVAETASPGEGVASGPPGFVFCSTRLSQIYQAVQWREHAVELAVQDITPGAPAQTVVLPMDTEAVDPEVPPVSLDREVLGRVWRLSLQPHHGMAARLGLLSPERRLAHALVLTLLVAALVEVRRMRRRADAEGQDQHARMSSLLAQAGDAVVAIDLAGRVQLWNGAAEQLFGWSAQDARGRMLGDLTLTPDTLDEHEALHRAAARGEPTVALESTRRHRWGHPVPVELSAGPITDRDGVVVGVAKFFRPIADRLAQRALQAEQERLLSEAVAERTQELRQMALDMRQVLDALPTGVSVWDTEGVNRYANAAYARLSGRPAEAVRGLHVSAVLPPEQLAVAEPHRQAAQQGEERHFDVKLPRVGGSGSLHLHVHCLPRRDAQGQVRDVLVLVHDLTSLVRGRESLAALQREWQAVQMAMQNFVPVSMTDLDGTLLEVNDAFCRISGYDRSELLGRNHRVVGSGRHEPAFWAAMWGEIGQGRPWQGEVCNRHRSGDLYWVRTAIVPLVDEAGLPQRYVSIRSDVTALRVQAEALRRSEADLGRTGRIAQVGGWTATADDGQLCLSDQACAILGVPPGSCFGLASFVQRFLPGLTDGADQRLLARLASGEGLDCEMPLRRADGSSLWVRLMAEVEEGGLASPRRLVGVVQDLSLQRQASLAVREARELLLTGLDATGIALTIFGPDDRLQLWNPSFGALYPLVQDELVAGLPFADLSRRITALYASPAMDEAWQARRLRTFRDGGDWTVQLNDGRWLRVVERVLPNGQFVSLRSDVTQLVVARRVAEAASRAKSEFIAVASHEIRTPLNAIIGLSYLLEQAELPAEIQADVAQIAQAGQTLLGLVNDVLDLSIIEAGEMRLDLAPVDLRRELREVMDLVAAAGIHPGVQPEVLLAPELPRQVLADAKRLRQILTNLLGNAFKFTAAGRVSLAAGPGAEPGWVEFSVADTGIGIAPEMLERVFQPFEQVDASSRREHGGTGLGLSIAARLVALMGGRIHLDSRLGSGSRFSLQLPLAACGPADGAGAGLAAPVAPLLAPARTVVMSGRREAGARGVGRRVGTAGRSRLAGLQVVVVDDSPINLDFLSRLLQSEGALARTCSGGEELLRRLDDDLRGLDLLLLDMQMPGMDGCDVARAVRQRAGLADLPILAVSAGVSPQARSRALAAGMDDFLVKPLQPAQLFRALDGRLGRRQPDAVVWELVPGDAIPARAARAATPTDVSAATAGSPGVASGAALGAAQGAIPGIDESSLPAAIRDDLPLRLSMLQRFLSDYADFGRTPADQVEARSHKLAGSALVIGATAIGRAAQRLNQLCRQQPEDDLLPRVLVLAAQIEALKRHAAAPLQAEAVRLAAELDDQARQAADQGRRLRDTELEELVHLLETQNAQALARVQALVGPLSLSLGTARVAALRLALGNFEFEQALRLLEGREEVAPGDPAWSA